MTKGWLADHRPWSLLVGLCIMAPFALGLDPSMPNPISAQLEANRLADAALVVVSGLLLHVVNSRTAADLWVDTGRNRRVCWFAALTVVSLAAILFMGPVRQPSVHTLVVALGCSWAIPALAVFWADLMAGLLCLFAMAATMLLTPQGDARPWWSPIYDPSPSGLWVGLSLLALGSASWVYSTNAGGRRRF